MLPPPQPVARFRRDFEALGPVPDRIGVAVSGGPDSLALLLLAAAVYPGRIAAVTVDHKLRPESTLEALHVEDICARIGCPHSILEVAVPDGPGGLQAEARAVRYSALGRWVEAEGLSHVATAHHADDQAETVLMRLQRGSGLSGLQGIRPLRREGSMLVVRPLLGWTKAELVHIVSEAAVAFVEDPSNGDRRFDRAEMRRFLSGNPQFQPHRIARSASALGEADAAIAWAADRLWEERCTRREDELLIDASGLPRELGRRLLSRAIGELRRRHGLEPPWTGAEDVEGLLSALEAGDTATRAGILATGGSVWRLRLAPPRRQA
jgi:tRNA(Ile)-lysidine synthase